MPTPRRSRISPRAGLNGFFLILFLATGCGQPGQTDPSSNLKALIKEEQGNSQAGGTNGGGDGSAKAQNVVFDPKFHVPFGEATSLEPPDDQSRPPDMTVSGKSVGKIFQAIAGDNGKGGLWDKVKFASPTGQPLQYTATIQTDLGDISLELFGDKAPNHVRNFVALAQAGYYEGLAFDRAVKEEVATEPGKFLEYLEAGCPRGTGEPGFGSIGYWMRPEFSSALKHEEGTIGASHGEDMESGACKFYITLNKAPWLDGQYSIFGRVTQGMDIVRRIYARPRAEDAPDRPQNPVRIRAITIQNRPASPGTSG